MKNFYYRQCTEQSKEITRLHAALDDGARKIKFMDRKGAQFCDEMKVLRMKMARWDQRNWAEMAIALLKGPQRMAARSTTLTTSVTA